MLDLHFLLAERQGFEPRVPRGTTVFKTAAIDHSATSPKLFSGALPFKSDAKVRIFFKYANFKQHNFNSGYIIPLKNVLLHIIINLEKQKFYQY